MTDVKDLAKAIRDHGGIRWASVRTGIAEDSVAYIMFADMSGVNYYGYDAERAARILRESGNL